MDSIYIVIAITAGLAITAGIKMIWCDHQHQVRHDRRATDHADEVMRGRT